MGMMKTTTIRLAGLGWMLAASISVASAQTKTPRAPAADKAGEATQGKRIGKLNDLKVEWMALDVQLRNKRDAIFELLGDMSADGQFAGLSDAQLTSLIATLSSLSEQDAEAQAAPLVLELISIHGAKKINNMIAEQDKTYALRKRMRTVTEGKQ